MMSRVSWISIDCVGLTRSSVITRGVTDEKGVVGTMLVDVEVPKGI